jgi:C4-dicarboxylate-specific signal transduction histidine kinase
MSIEEPRPAEKRLIKVSRQLRTLAQCGNAFFHAATEHELLQSICEILVAGDDLSLVWIGYCESPSEFIRPVAKAGAGVEFFEHLRLSGDAHKIESNPVSVALSSGKSFCVNDIAADSRSSFWRIAAIEAGHASCVAIPLTAYGRRQGNIDLRGTLHLCSRERGFFDENTIEHYANVASYLTFAVTALRTSLSEGLTSGVAALRAKQERQMAQHNLQTMREELARVTRLGEMSQISASIAHEINQPLAAIVMNGNAGLRWLSRSVPDLDEARGTLTRIIEDGKRASEVVVSIRSMFKNGDQTRSLQNINEVVREVLTFVRGKIENDRVLVRTELDQKLPDVLVSRVQLQQVILNLVSNAIEAMSYQQQRERMLVLTSELVEPAGIRVAVKDTGIGIDKDKIQRVFDPFFTTKSDGIGLGLAICRSIIESYGGHLMAAQGHPHGAVFSFVIPIAEKT